MPCAAWRGIFQSLDRHGARFGFAVALFCGTAVLSAQDYCIIYRGAVVVNEGRQLKRLVTKKARLIGLLVILTISSMNGFVGYFLTTFEYTPEEHPALRVIMNQGSDAFICISIGTSPIYPAPRIVLPFAGIMEVTFYCLAIATVIFIRRASLKMSQKSKALNSQLSWLLLTQTTVPIVGIFVPFLLILLPMFLEYRISAESTMVGFLVFSSFPLINAVLTIAFVKPYRDFTFQLLVRRKTGRNSVVWTTDQQAAAAARAGARNPSISTSSLRNTHSPGHSMI